MKKYLVVTPDYPSEENKYATAFVHSRVKNYVDRGLNVEVFKVNRRKFGKPQNGKKYSFQGVDVEIGNLEELGNKIKKNSYDKILIHFGYQTVVSKVLETFRDKQVIIWFHGSDIISWKRRTYNITLQSFPRFFAYSILNIKQRMFLKKIILKEKERITFVFVSKWLKEIAEIDTRTIGKIKKVAVIPNIVDEKIFEYKQKFAKDRLNILTIRSFETRKYANDIVTKTIIKLSEKPYFNQLKFTICGKGKMWNKHTDPLKKFPNVKLENRFFSHQEIVDLHSENGVMLMPSRQDTHGISTCEGMSSGLVGISSNNSAIPEYVPQFCSYLGTKVDDFVAAIDDIVTNPDKYLIYSEETKRFIRDKCSSKVVITEEIKLIEE